MTTVAQSPTLALSQRGTVFSRQFTLYFQSAMDACIRG